MADDDGRAGELPPPNVVARRLAMLPDPQMRRARLHELLRTGSPQHAAWLLDGLASAGRAGGPPYDLSLLAVVDLVNGDHLDPDHREAIVAAAEAHHLEACQELLRRNRETTDDQAAAPRPLIPGTRPLTLGERKALARSWQRDVLERLLVDPHVDVVRLLLGNPHVTETDILQIATSRRSSAAVLMLVVQARKWGRSPRVRKALVRNPHLPEATAIRLVGLLNRSELRELARDPSLPGALNDALVRRLRPPS